MRVPQVPVVLEESATERGVERAGPEIVAVTAVTLAALSSVLTVKFAPPELAGSSCWPQPAKTATLARVARAPRGSNCDKENLGRSSNMVTSFWSAVTIRKFSGADRQLSATVLLRELRNQAM